MEIYDFTISICVDFSGGRDKVIILWDMKNSFNKIKTIPLPNPIEGLLLAPPFDLYMAVSPSEIMHFDLKTQSLAKDSVLSLNKDETITGLHVPVAQEKPSVCKFLVSTHTSAIYDISVSQNDGRNSISINRQVIILKVL